MTAHVSDPIPCFWARPTGLDKVYRRRFASPRPGEPPCHRLGYHNALLEVGLAESGGPCRPATEDEKALPGWPAVCPCGYAFRPEDHWQVFVDTLLEGPGGLRFAKRDAPAGAMWAADWLAGTSLVNPKLDRPPVCVKLPGGHEFVVDSKSSDGSFWSVTGEPPRLTVSPSIHVRAPAPAWHGWLREGVLVEA